MDRQDSWKKTDEIEIDLTQLLQSLLMQWKRIAACALACAIIFGAAGWLKNQSNTDIDAAAMAEEAELSETEKQAVADALLLEQETRRLENYLENSVLMQIDPYHKNRQVLLYCIDGAKRQELAVITESYLNFIVNGGAADALLETGSGAGLDKSLLSELVSAYQKAYSSPYQVAVKEHDSSMTSESLFYAEVTGKDAADARKLAGALQEVLEAYSKKVQETAGKHRLSLAGSMESVTADSGLLGVQHDKKAALSANKTSLKAMTDGFSIEQMAVYEEAVLQESRNSQNETGKDLAGSGKAAETDSRQKASVESLKGENPSSEGSLVKSVLKYAVPGFFAGIAAYCCLSALWYMFHDTVKSTDELKRVYAFPVYGAILADDGSRTKKSRGKMPGTHQDAFGQTEAQVLNRIRLSCQKQGITSLCAAADFPLDDSEKNCLERMAGQLKQLGIDMHTAENASADTAAWDSLAETGNVLMIVKTGVTTHRMIDDAMRFYLENGIAVAGAAAFVQE